MGGFDFNPQLNIEAVVVLIAAAVAGVFLSFIPLLFQPFQLLFTTIHELGHVFAAILTGGEVKGFEVYLKKKMVH